MEETKWEEIRQDWKDRMELAKIEGIKQQKDALDDIFKHLEINDLNLVLSTGKLPVDVFIIADVSDDNTSLVSRKWNEPLCSIGDIFKYEKAAVERDNYYKLVGIENIDNRYEEYLNFLTEQQVLTGDTITIDFEELSIDKNTSFVELIKENANQAILVKSDEQKKKKKLSEGDDEDDEMVEEEDENGDIVRSDDVIQLDDDFDDTFAEMPDDYNPIIEIKIEEDEWGF